MQQVNPSFNIQASEIDFESAQLFAEAGPAGILLAVLGANNFFEAVVTYQFSACLSDTELTENLKSICATEYLLQKKYSKTHIFWGFTESILVPADLMNADANTSMLNLVFGDARQGVVRSDFLYKLNIHNVYRLPRQVADVLAGCMPVATQTHLFSALVNHDIPAISHTTIRYGLSAIFYSKSLTIVLRDFKECKLKLVQNFTYANADNCVFHLLNVCKGFDVEPDTVILNISGMIDEKSGLYAAIYKYFLDIHFDVLPGEYSYTPEINNYPPHFFSHLFRFASCV